MLSEGGINGAMMLSRPGLLVIRPPENRSEHGSGLAYELEKTASIWVGGGRRPFAFSSCEGVKLQEPQQKGRTAVAGSEVGRYECTMTGNGGSCLVLLRR